MWRALLDALAPPRCAGCDRVAPDVLCERCVEEVRASPVPAVDRRGRPPAHAAFVHAGPVRRALHVGKYRGGRRALRLIGLLAAERLAPVVGGGAGAGMLVPVPLARRRGRARGYNQAAVLAAALAEMTGAPPVVDGLRRLHETASQVGRGAAGRRANLEGAFAWTGPPPGVGTVWLVDDVRTTGATLAQAAIALQQAGARRIEGVTVSAAPPPPG